MIIPLRLRRWSVALIFVSMGAVSSVSASRSSPTLFSDAGASVGQNLSVTGYLLYEAENKNLYPSLNWHHHWLKKECLPIGVRVNDEEMSDRLRQLNHRKVVVHGTVKQLVQKGDLNDSLCKDVGLMIDDVRAYTK